MNQISVCLWYNNQAEEAARLYAEVFKSTKTLATSYYNKASAEISGQKEGSVLTIDMQIENLVFQLLNGGPMFKFSPSLSLFLSFTDEKELQQAWSQLSKGGQLRMALDQYPWAEKYGWTTDRFGVEWQFILAPNPQKIMPALLFTDELFGRGEEALQYYTSLFPGSKITSMSKDPKSKTIQHCTFNLKGQEFVLMEGAGKHGHQFTHATSITVPCANQKEIDHLHEGLSRGGDVEACGWVQDKYGVSWQIVPDFIDEIMKDPARSGPAMDAILKMKKLDYEVLSRF